MRDCKPACKFDPVSAPIHSVSYCFLEWRWVNSRRRFTSLDFEERVIRMGYGDMGAVRMLHDVNILIYHVPGLQVIIGLTVIVQ